MINYTNVNTYDYFLPEDLIAQTPVEPRDSSRMMVFDSKTKKVEHKHFYNIADYLVAGDVLVINNTRVLPARLYGYKSTGAKLEVLLLKRHSINVWECLMKPAKRLHIGEELVFSEELKCKLLEILPDGNRKIEFIYDGVLEDILSRVGTMPLPPYIREKLSNQERYQTVYSKTTSSAAAPTAGLHFTRELMDKLKAKGIIFAEVTLDVGLGTFRPCKEEDITKHDMHTEHYNIGQETCDIINKAKAEGRRVIAVGTTSVRTLESVARYGLPLQPKSEDTSIFIYPPYEFKVVDALITNFHLPKSTLIMLVSAFAGLDNTMNIYKTAVENKYRFFSFGDSMLIV
ncbi:MAG: tRNA preQ1(34) S-adenosylmethionine ribosyltransferase-isomerase QueA, partial [Clostridia bacterium]|nr:tRNA preQ1(34) S-adenosylmethionine ribosyltransferase-isomerase QueA [Clostridia bacterium]